MRIAIIGGAGFIGTRLSKRLDSTNYNYDVYDKDTSICKKALYLDIEDPKTLSQIDGNDIIINLAAEHKDDIQPLSRYYDVNVQGSKNICDAARKHAINKIVFTSSVAIYGFATPDTDESGTPNYFNEYGRTKYLAEEVFKDWQSEDPENRTLVILRPTVVFGEGNRGNVYNLLNQIAKGMFVMFGNGMNKKSMAYVGNVVSVIKNTINKPVKGINTYNYADKPDMTMCQLIKLIEAKLKIKVPNIYIPYWIGMLLGYFFDFFAFITKKKFPISSIRIKKFCATTQYNAEKIHSLITVPFSIEDALSRTLQYEFVDEEKDSINFLTE